MSTETSVAQAKARFSEYLRQAELGEPVVITRYGKAVAALVSADLLESLRRLQAAGPEQGLAGLAGRWDDPEDLLNDLDDLSSHRATDARVNLGSLQRRLAESGDAVVVEEARAPAAVILSIDEYHRLKAGQGTTPSLSGLRLAKQARLRTGRELQGRALPSPEEILDEVRHERGADLFDLR